MTRLPTPGQDDGTWGNVLNDFLAQAHATDGSLKPASVNSAISSGSIIKTQLSSGVQASLDNADAAAAGTIADNSVSTVKIQDGAVTTPKLAAGVQTSLTAADNAIPTSQKGAASGVASLDSGTKLTASQLPANVVTKSADSNDTGKAIDAYTGSPLALDSLSVTSITDGPYTVVDGDEVIQMTSANPETINVPSGLSQQIMEIANLGTGTLTVSATTATFLPAGSVTLGQDQSALLRQATTNNWLVSVPFDSTSIESDITSLQTDLGTLQSDWRFRNPRREAYGMWPNEEIPTSSTTLNVNNQLYYRRFIPRENMTATGVAWALGTLSTNNDAVDFAILSSTGSRLASTGSLSGRLNATLGQKYDAFTATVDLVAGTEYFVCMCTAYAGGTAASVGGYNLLGGAVAILNTATVGTADKYVPNGLRANGAVTIGSSPGIPTAGAQSVPGLFIRGTRTP